MTLPVVVKLFVDEGKDTSSEGHDLCVRAKSLATLGSPQFSAREGVLAVKRIDILTSFSPFEL